MKYFSPHTAACALAMALAGHTPAAQAQLNVGATASLGHLSYEIESSAQQNWSGSAKLASVGADVSLPGGFYVGLSTSTTLSGALDFTFQGTPQNSSAFRRHDTALTIGLSPVGSLSTFVGLRTGRTAIDNVVNTAFKTAGYFVGLAYPFGIGPNRLSVSLAIGSNKGSWSDSTGSVSDTAFGYSGGIRYAYTFTPQLAATAGLKVQNYRYDFTEAGFGTLREKVNLFDIGLNYNF